MENFLRRVVLDLMSKLIFALIFPIHLVRDALRISATIVSLVLNLVNYLMEFALPVYIMVNDKPLSYFMTMLPIEIYMRLLYAIDNFLVIVSYNIRAIIYGEKLTASIKEIRRRGF